VHQPYRAAICPQLPKLLPLAGDNGILGVALSGAGPAVLAIVESEHEVERASRAIFEAMQEIQRPELLVCGFQAEGAAIETGVRA
jgi:homoserine kinase